MFNSHENSLTGTNVGVVKNNPSGNAEKLQVKFYRTVVPAYMIKEAGAGKAKTTASDPTEEVGKNSPVKTVTS